MYRFASSEKVYLLQLARDVKQLCGLDVSVHDSSLEVPIGLLDSKSILQNLLDALNFQCAHARLLLASRSHADYQCIDNRFSGILFDKSDKIQSVCMRALQCHADVSQNVLRSSILANTAVSFSRDAVDRFELSPDWFAQLYNTLGTVKYYVRMCWLKTVAGAWTTTVRTHELKNTDVEAWSCLFGCACVPDQLDHYMSCPLLWHIVNTVLIGEEYFSLRSRICFDKPTKVNLQRLAIAHGVYHQCKHDSLCIVDFVPAAPIIVQSRAEGFAKACLRMAT